MDCIKPVRIYPKRGDSILLPEYYADGLLVPCGKCLACRIQKRREWSMRMLHEVNYHENTIFLTLTYSDAHLPKCMSLKKSDLQKFFKRLRKDLAKNGRKIKYFACGEYGDELQRPHYHAIVYGLNLTPTDKILVMDNWPYCDWSVPAIKKNSFGLAETLSIQYVAQYIDKKFTGDLAITTYDEQNRESVFRILSLGIGRQYALDNTKQIEQLGFITVRGIKQSIPRYYLKLLNLDITKIQQEAEFKECETIERKSGLCTTSDAYYKTQKASKVVDLNEQIKKSKMQHESNLKAKIERKVSKI